MFVVKIGGSKGINLDYVLEDIALQVEPLVMVHGASDELNQISTQLGKPPRPGGLRSQRRAELRLSARTLLAKQGRFC